MADSLRDQLIKAGLVSQERAEKLAKDKKKQQAQQPKLKKAVRAQTQQAAVNPSVSAAQAAKAERDKALNAAKAEQLAQKALKAQIRELVMAHKLDTKDGAETYYFQHINRAKRVIVTKEQHEQLSKSLLAISVLDKNYYVIPVDIAHKILERAPQYAVYIANQHESTAPPDDLYANFQVPDDLRW